jgi:quercetin dioxygenase-like cupin family protein
LQVPGEVTLATAAAPHKEITMKFRIIAATCAALAFWMVGPASAGPVFNGVIPNIPGKSLIAAEVNYGPGEATPAHTHDASAFIFAYVVSGAIESKVNDGETRIYHAGESFTESPGAIHWISRNASKTEPAKMLVVFVVDTNHKAMLTPMK